MQRFGEKLRTLRTRRGMTLRELAAQLGYNAHVYLSLVETGKKKPSLELVMKVAKLFNISADRLLDDALEVKE
ncbi:MAG: helix-turn-helix domain-containing protein [Chloroflexaceae bacterium]